MFFRVIGYKNSYLTQPLDHEYLKFIFVLLLKSLSQLTCYILLIHKIWLCCQFCTRLLSSFFNPYSICFWLLIIMDKFKRMKNLFSILNLKLYFFNRNYFSPILIKTTLPLIISLDIPSVLGNKISFFSGIGFLLSLPCTR